MIQTTAQIEMLAGVIRVFPPGRQYGDAYAWSGAVRALSPTVIELIGVTAVPTEEERHAMARAFIEQGYEQVIWHRIRKDKVHKARINLERFLKHD